LAIANLRSIIVVLLMNKKGGARVIVRVRFLLVLRKVVVQKLKIANALICYGLFMRMT
jgi:hypothetical protein